MRVTEAFPLGHTSLSPSGGHDTLGRFVAKGRTRVDNTG